MPSFLVELVQNWYLLEDDTDPTPSDTEPISPIATEFYKLMRKQTERMESYNPALDDHEYAWWEQPGVKMELLESDLIAAGPPYLAKVCTHVFCTCHRTDFDRSMVSRSLQRIPFGANYIPVKPASTDSPKEST